MKICLFKGSFPIRDNYELEPGTKSREKQDPNQKF
jgi:hypothetical protein